MQLGDARKLDQRTQEALRQRAVLLVEKGATHMEAAQAVGVHRGTVSRWCGAFRRNGASGIEKGRRGRRVGDQLMLTASEARRVQGWIANKGLFRSVRFDQHLVCDGLSGKGDGEK